METLFRVTGIAFWSIVLFGLLLTVIITIVAKIKEWWNDLSIESAAYKIIIFPQRIFAYIVNGYSYLSVLCSSEKAMRIYKSCRNIDMTMLNTIQRSTVRYCNNKFKHLDA